MHIFERNIANKITSQADGLFTTIKTKVQEAIVTAMENMASPRVEVATKSVNAHSGRDVDTVVQDPYHKHFSRKIASLQMTDLCQKRSNTDLNENDEARGFF